MSTMGAGSVGIGTLSIDAGPMAQSQARHLAEMVAAELGQALMSPGVMGAYGFEPLTPPGNAPLSADKVVVDVRAQGGQKPEQLAAAIARAILAATAEQVVR